MWSICAHDLQKSFERPRPSAQTTTSSFLFSLSNLCQSVFERFVYFLEEKKTPMKSEREKKTPQTLSSPSVHVLVKVIDDELRHARSSSLARPDRPSSSPQGLRKLRVRVVEGWREGRLVWVRMVMLDAMIRRSWTERERQPGHTGADINQL